MKKSATNKPVSRSVPPARPARRIDLWHGTFFLLGAVLTGWFLLAHREAGPTPRRPGGALPESAPGPRWGQLEYIPIELERPDDSIALPPSPLSPPAWVFEHCTESQVLDLFASAGLSPAQRDQLSNRAHWTPTSTGWSIAVPAEAVRGLSAAARARIHAELRKSPLNHSRGRPFRIAAEKFEGWLVQCGLSPARQAELRALTYREGAMVCFADYEILEADCTADEQRHLAKALSQCTALLMMLHVTPKSDIEALAGYWGPGGRGDTMKPFLESLARVPEGTSVSVSFFFPTFARLRLFTYPDPAVDRLAAREDCFWTALNFHNETPDNRFLNEDVIQKTLRTEYTETASNWAFGDLILVLEEGRTAIHLCVYIADDIVFTKNGNDPLRPWVLMKIPDMLDEYRAAQGKRMEIVGLHRKTELPTSSPKSVASAERRQR